MYKKPTYEELEQRIKQLEETEAEFNQAKKALFESERDFNAFLEAIYFCRPIVVNTYSIYTIDIKPKGFSVIEIDGYVTDEAVRKTKKVLTNPDLRKKMVTHNYQTAKKYYSYTVLAKKLGDLITDCTGCQRLLNRT